MSRRKPDVGLARIDCTVCSHEQWAHSSAGCNVVGCACRAYTNKSPTGSTAASTAPAHVDIRVQDHGTVFLLFPASDAGEQWLREHTPPDATWWGRALVVEPRSLPDIVAGARADGLKVA